MACPFWQPLNDHAGVPASGLQVSITIEAADENPAEQSVAGGHDNLVAGHFEDLNDLDGFELLDRPHTPGLQALGVLEFLRRHRALMDEGSCFQAHHLTSEAEEYQLDQVPAGHFHDSIEMMEEDDDEYEPDYDPVHFSMSVRPSASPHSPMSSMQSSMFLSSHSSDSSRRSPSRMSFQLFGHTLVGLEGISGGIDGYFFVSAPLKLSDPESHLVHKKPLVLDAVEKGE